MKTKALAYTLLAGLCCAGIAWATSGGSTSSATPLRPAAVPVAFRPASTAAALPGTASPVAASPLAASATVVTAGRSAAPLGCLIEASEIVEVGTSVIGVLASVSVDRGDVIRRGQVLARLEAGVEFAALTLAQAKLTNQADIESARAQKAYAVKKAERTAELTALKFVSGQARDQAETEASMADMKLAQTLEQQAIAAHELQLARAQLAQRTVYSPLNGVVVDRMASVGERIENRPILKLAQIDPLRVEVVLPASQFNAVKPGMTARVFPELQGSSAQTATVAVVDRVIDAASNTFRARLSLPNAHHSLPSGVRCKVEFAAAS